MPVNPANFEKHTKALEKSWPKTEIARRGNEYGKIYRIPFTSPSLNWATYGGCPIGRWTRLYGDYSSAKSLLCWDIIRSAQNIGVLMEEHYTAEIEKWKDIGDKARVKELKEEYDVFRKRFPDEGLTCAYYNVEGIYHEEFVASRGVDVEKLWVIEGQEIEKIGEAMEVYMGSVHLHVVDSTSAATAVRVLNSDVTEEPRQVDSQRWKEMFKRVESRFDTNENTVAYVSHATMAFGGRGEEPIGGRKLNFSSSNSLHCRHGTWLYKNSKGVLVDKGSEYETISGLKEPDGVEVTVRVAKSRVNPPFRTARVRLDFDEMGFDVGYEISQAAKFYNLVDRGGPYIYPLDPESGERLGSCQGEAPFREFIRENPEWSAHVIEQLMSGKKTIAGDVPDDKENEEDV